MNALRYNIKRIFFGGFFIRGHPYTMDTISYAIRFWSKVGVVKGVGVSSHVRSSLPHIEGDPSSYSLWHCLALLPQGEMAATFLRHEGFLGAVGAFLKASTGNTSTPVHPHSLHLGDILS